METLPWRADPKITTVAADLEGAGSRDVPDAQGGVHGGGQQPSAIRADSDVVYAVPVAPEPPNQSARLHIVPGSTLGFIQQPCFRRYTDATVTGMEALCSPSEQSRSTVQQQ